MIAAALGSLVGLVLGLTGAGGSIFAVPLLVMGLGLTLVEATPIALLAVFGATALGTLTALRSGQLCLRAALPIGILGSITAPLGVHLASLAPQAALFVAFAVVMLIVAWRMMRQARRTPADASIVRATGGRDARDASGAVCRFDPGSQRLRWSSPCALMLGLSGTGTGMLSGALGVGAGFIIIPTLRGVAGLSMNRSVATSLMAIAIISGSAVASHLLQGTPVSMSMAAPFLGGALAGMLAGRAVAPRVSGPRLQQAFAALMTLVALGMAYRGIAGF